MDFYYEWLNKKNTDKEINYIIEFLSSTEETTKAFNIGDEKLLAVALSVICSSSIESYIDIIDCMELSDSVYPDQVPQYSDFNDGAVRVSELLEFEPNGMGFEKLGYQLVKSSEGAGIKYGENHAKLARTMGLVEISNRPSNVKSTCLGRYLLKLNDNEKNEVLRRMLLRNYSIQKILKESKESTVSYERIMKNLSPKTATRRRNNVKSLLEFILTDTAYYDRMKNINWKVNL